MIRADSLTKSFLMGGRRITALDNVSIAVAQGEFVAIVGPSGSGKSTLLLTIGGLAQPDGGSVLLNGCALYDLSAADRARIRRQDIGFLFQTFNLVPYLTALENVQVPLYCMDVPPNRQRERARNSLEAVGLGDRLDHKPAELSVGQQQRVALARALANEPDLILADEPTGSLDPQCADEVMSELERLHADGKTIVLVSHDPRVAVRAQRKLRIESGRMVAE